jgi:hypothetical protein
MAFRWLFAFLSNCISTNVDGHFEFFFFPHQKITLVGGLGEAHGGGHGNDLHR